MPAKKQSKKKKHHLPVATPNHSAPYPVSRLAPPYDLVDLAKEIQQADQIIDLSLNSKLSVIAGQINALQSEAKNILEQARKDMDLHRAECKFKRQPGSIYHLYQKPDGSQYFSMLSVEDWRQRPPHSFIGSFRLEVDMSWTPVNK